MNSSDKNRRTMTDALQSVELSDEARDFLNGDKVEKTSTEPSAPKSAPISPKEESTDTPNLPRQDLHPTTMTFSASPHFSVVVPAIASMTFRLPASLAAQLVGVAAERKMRRERPFTQQDIVAEALQQWFVLHGYVDFNPK